MYRNCIFCSAALGSNNAVERFPVGRTLAFDGGKGRLWTVCRKCARWNLAPLEERWEAIEDAERLFRDTHLRVQSENIGIAKLRDGTRLVRIGAALAGEVAAWRYGREMARRRLRWKVDTGAGLALSIGLGVGAVLSLPAIFMAYPLLGVADFWKVLNRHREADRVAHRVQPADSPTGAALSIRWRDLRLARTALGDDGRLEVWLVQTAHTWTDDEPLPLRGPAAAAVLGKALVRINGSGAPDRQVSGSVETVAKAGGAEAFLRRAAALERGLEVPGLEYGPAISMGRHKEPWRTREERADRPIPLSSYSSSSLALEMALHEESERRAMDGELAALEAMWREAEQIAGIADSLPDVPAPDPPRLGA